MPKILIIFSLLVIAAYFLINFGNFSLHQPTALVNNSIFVLEVADSDEERILGLSGRESLSEKNGLLFIFEESGYHGIWMKDMKFPIDILWITDDKISSIESNVSPETYPEIFYPQKAADKVLEINAGLSEKLDINVGDSFILK